MGSSLRKENSTRWGEWLLWLLALLSKRQVREVNFNYPAGKNPTVADRIVGSYAQRDKAVEHIEAEKYAALLIGHFVFVKPNDGITVFEGFCSSLNTRQTNYRPTVR